MSAKLKKNKKKAKRAMKRHMNTHTVFGLKVKLTGGQKVKQASG